MADAIGFKPTSVNVHGLTALIRNLGRDCTPEQFMREFVQNSIEACERTGLDGRRVLVDFNHGIQQHSGIFKLCFTDNGDGMTLEQMNDLLNSISASGGSTNKFENYGVGAKISSLTRNLFGVQYESWKGGLGHSIIIRYNPKFDVFGIQGFPDDKGNVLYHRVLSPAQRPSMIQEHGTRVTLFGNNLEQDTMAPPYGIHGQPGQWLYEYLNRRYFKLPEGLAIDVRIGYDQDLKNPELCFLKRLEGFGDTLRSCSYDRGSLDLNGARAHWWLLKEGSAIRGHTALLNQNEIFSVEDDRSSRLTHFGVLLGRDRVVIMVEPHEASQNIARTHLKRPDGSEFSWHAWQDEFRTKLPEPIQRYLEELLNQRKKPSAARAIQLRLMSLRSLYELCGFKPLLVHKPVEINKNEPGELAYPDPISPEPKEDQDKPQESKPPVDPPSAENTGKKEEGGDEGSTQPQEDYFPRVEWTTEQLSPQLTGRAAEFVEYSNIILANQDFKGFEDLFKYFVERFELTDEQKLMVRHSIQEHAEQALMESVAGVISLKNEPHWGGSYHQALTKEALSAVVLQRFWSAKAIESQIESILKAPH